MDHVLKNDFSTMWNTTSLDRYVASVHIFHCTLSLVYFEEMVLWWPCCGLFSSNGGVLWGQCLLHLWSNFKVVLFDMAVQVKDVSISGFTLQGHLELPLNCFANIMWFEHPLWHSFIKFGRLLHWCETVVIFKYQVPCYEAISNSVPYCC